MHPVRPPEEEPQVGRHGGALVQEIRERREPDGPAAEALDERSEDAAVELVESVVVDLELVQRPDARPPPGLVLDPPAIVLELLATAT